MKPTIIVLISCMPLLACGPTIGVESSDGEASTSVATPSTGGTTPMTTVGPTTTPPGDTTLGPQDTGVFDTGEVWLDLPESCSTFEQDCPPGYKCMPWANDGGGAWNDTKCVPVVPDPAAPGEPCTVEGSNTSGIDDCDVGSMCWDVDPETNMGICVSHCIGDFEEPACPEPCHECVLGSEAVITLCFPTCDPITQNCGPGEACYPINSTFACAPDASPRGTGIGSPCEYINVCPPGMFCLAQAALPDCMGSIGCCAPVCPAGGADPCPGLLPGTECTPWFEDGQLPPELCVTAEPGVCVALQ